MNSIPQDLHSAQQRIVQLEKVVKDAVSNLRLALVKAGQEGNPVDNNDLLKIIKDCRKALQ